MTETITPEVRYCEFPITLTKTLQTCESLTPQAWAHPYEPPRQSLQTVRVGNYVLQVRLHSILKMESNQRVVKGGKREYNVNNIRLGGLYGKV